MSQTTSPTAVPPNTAPTVTPQQGTNLFGGSAVGSATVGPATNTTPYNPSSAYSPYMSQQVETAQAQVGSTLSAVLGLTPGQHAIGDIMHAFEDLSSGELVQLETLLWQGGFYVDAEGNPLPTPPTFGSRDAQSFDALINASLTASQGSVSLDQAIQSNIGQGVGANLRANLPQAVTGGGNLYTIDLTNVADVRLAATQIFQAALGRNPTAAEVNAVTGSVNSQALAQGYAKEAAKEGLSQTAYNTALGQRNAAYQYQTTPKLAAGDIPNGPITNPAQYAISLLQYMNQNAQAGKGIPLTTSNVAFVLGMMKATGLGLNGKNPMGSMLALSGATPSQSGGPPQYSSWAQSIQATAQSLMSGPYAWTMAALANGDASNEATSQNVMDEINKWSNGAFSNISKQAKSATSQAQNAIQSVTITASPQPGATASPPGDTGKQASMDLGAGNMGAGQGAITVPAGTTVAGLQSGAPGASQLPASGSTVNPADVNPGQQVTNPTDAYISPVTAITTNPASADAAAYQAATTGANRPGYLGNQYLNAYQAILSMIKAGGPTSG